MTWLLVHRAATRSPVLALPAECAGQPAAALGELPVGEPRLPSTIAVRSAKTVAARSRKDDVF